MTCIAWRCINYSGLFMYSGPHGSSESNIDNQTQRNPRSDGAWGGCPAITQRRGVSRAAPSHHSCTSMLSNYFVSHQHADIYLHRAPSPATPSLLHYCWSDICSCLCEPRASRIHVTLSCSCKIAFWPQCSRNYNEYIHHFITSTVCFIPGILCVLTQNFESLCGLRVS